MTSEDRRKCIGVLIAKPDRDYQKGILCGIYKAAFESNMSVAVFSSTIDGGNDAVKASELEIFSLPNYDLLSGIIYLPMTFDFATTDKDVGSALLAAVREKKLPAITVDAIVEELPCVICDDTETISSTIEHLIKDHGCRDIAYMTGTKGHPHAESRLDIYKKVMQKNGLHVLSDRTYYGDFWLGEGDNFVERLCKSENGLPDAIVCANSYMAYSVYKALKKRNINVPDDILLANYSDEADLYDFITGSIKEADAAGYTACRTLIGMMEGKLPESPVNMVKCGSRLKKSVSCGCVSAGSYDFSNFGGVVDLNDGESYFGEFNPISTDLISRPGYSEMFYAIDWYTCFLEGAKGIYFCLCDGWNNPALSTENEVRRGYTDCMQIYYSRVNHDDGTHSSLFDGREYFPVEEMFPKMFDIGQPPSSYIFRPLHFNDRVFGYIVIDNGAKMQTYDTMLDYWLRDVSNAMESQRRLQNMKYLYSSDFMTGIYNRNGFYQMMPELLDKAVKERRQILVAVFDLNGMKYINDTFGHNEGDTSIKIAAEIISDTKLCGAEDERNFRIGGDEFVKAAVGKFTDADIAGLRDTIECRAKEYNVTSQKPYPVYISAGICVKNYNEEFTVDSMMHEADEQMFKRKAELRRITGFFPKR